MPGLWEPNLCHSQRAATEFKGFSEPSRTSHRKHKRILLQWVPVLLKKHTSLSWRLITAVPSISLLFCMLLPTSLSPGSCCHQPLDYLIGQPKHLILEEVSVPRFSPITTECQCPRVFPHHYCQWSQVFPHHYCFLHWHCTSPLYDFIYSFSTAHTERKVLLDCAPVKPWVTWVTSFTHQFLILAGVPHVEYRDSFIP